jgi:serine/threonine-protein kinase
MAAEAAAFAGDLETAIDLVERSYDAGFFDLHWLEKCPLLDGMRADPRYPPLHAKVKARAEAILDALYGDQGGVATQDTALATS